MLSPLPSRRWSRLALIVLGWAVLSFLFVPEAYLTFYYQGTPLEWWQTLELTALNSATALVFVPAIVWIARRVPLERGNWRMVLAIHVPACLVFSLVQSSIVCHTWDSHGGTLFYYHPNLFVYWAVAGVTQAIEYLRKYREHERRAARLQLRLLKVQLQPHFLFNTLNTISAMMREDVAAADGMINRLSELLRIVLTHVESDEVALAEELELLRVYLEIQQVRFGERLETNIEADVEARNALLPAFFLQPLVENSLRHGLAPVKKEGRILIRASRVDQQLILQVSDNGCGLPARRPVREGLGLSTTRSRLAHLYPQRHSFTIAAGPDGGVEVTAVIPFRTAATSSAERTSRYEYSDDHRGRRALGAGEDRIAPEH